MTTRANGTFVDRCKGPERTFANPFTSWHYRALPRPAYLTDVDGVEIESEYPVIIYEVKTIARSLYDDILAAKEQTSAQVTADFFGRINLWQLRALNRMVRPGLTEGYLVVTPSNADRFWIHKFDFIISHMEPGGEIRECLNDRASWGETGHRNLRKGFYPAEYVATWLMDKRRDLGLRWAELERDGYES